MIIRIIHIRVVSSVEYMAFRQMYFAMVSLFVISLFAHQSSVQGWWWPHHHPRHAPAPGQAPTPGHVPGHHHAYPDFIHNHKKIFVFGDSYADTGNSRTTEESWRCPYGMTIPGVPSGRYSDGLMLTDFFGELQGFACFLFTSSGFLIFCNSQRSTLES